MNFAIKKTYNYAKIHIIINTRQTCAFNKR